MDQNRLFESARPGDIFIAKMPYPEEVLAKIPEGHGVRPFLVVEKDGDHLYAYACTSSPKYEESVRYCLGYHGGDQFSWVIFSRIYVLGREHLVDFYCVLSREEQRNIQVKINGLKKLHPEYELMDLCLVQTFPRGSMVKDEQGNLYYVYKPKGERLSCFPCHPCDTKTDGPGLLFAGVWHHIDIQDLYHLHAQDVWPAGLISQRYIQKLQTAIHKKRARNEKESRDKSRKGADPVLVEFEFPAGAIFETLWGSEYLYLFSRGEKRYGLLLEGSYINDLTTIPVHAQWADTESEAFTADCVQEGREKGLIPEHIYRQIRANAAHSSASSQIPGTFESVSGIMGSEVSTIL